MEDYDVINEMHNIKEKIVMFVETDENLYEEIKNICECIPLRFFYDLSKFSEKYIDNTKGLFTFYYNNKNTYNNELLRFKKHFKHYNRSPFILYVNKDNDNYLTLKKIFDDLNIECVTNKKLFVKKIKNNKKLFLIDSDETLRNSKGIISEKNKLGIKKILSNNDYAVICTARPRYHTLDIMNQVHASNYIISSNGAELYDVKKDKIINSYFLSKSDLYKIIKESYKNEVRLVLTLEDYDYVTKNIRNKNQKLLDEKNIKSKFTIKGLKPVWLLMKKLIKLYY